MMKQMAEMQKFGGSGGASAMKVPKRVGILTAGGLAPCLSSAIGALIERYMELYPQVSIICYDSGYKGLLLGESIHLTKDVKRAASILHKFGGSPIGNSRVKLKNVQDCVKRGLVKEGEDPQKKAADQLVKDGSCPTLPSSITSAVFLGCFLPL